MTLTSQVICPSRVDGEGRGGAHGGRVVPIYCQHGEVVLGNQTDRMPLAVVKARAWGKRDKRVSSKVASAGEEALPDEQQEI